MTFSTERFPTLTPCDLCGQPTEIPRDFKPDGMTENRLHLTTPNTVLMRNPQVVDSEKDLMKSPEKKGDNIFYKSVIAVHEECGREAALEVLKNTGIKLIGEHRASNFPSASEKDIRGYLSLRFAGFGEK